MPILSGVRTVRGAAGGGEAVTFDVTVDGALSRGKARFTVQAKIDGANATRPVPFTWAVTDYGVDDDAPSSGSAVVSGFTENTKGWAAPSPGGGWQNAPNLRVSACTNGSGLYVVDLDISRPGEFWFWTGSATFTKTRVTLYASGRLDVFASPPFNVNAGQTLIMTFDGGAPITATFAPLVDGAMTLDEFQAGLYASDAGALIDQDNSGFGTYFGKTYTAASAIVVTGGSAKAALGL